MVSISEALGRVKEDFKDLLPAAAILAACVTAGQTFRDAGPLTPVNTVYVLLLQILHGNVAMEALPRLSGLQFTASAYCQARGRLKVELLRRLFTVVVEKLRPLGEAVGRWHGHRVFHMDGSGISMPDEPELQAEFGQPGNQKPGCGFPVAHLLVMFDAATGFLLDLIAAPLRTHDLAKCALMHPMLSAGDVLVGDRGFCSYAHLALLLQRSVHGLFRIHQRILVEFTEGRPWTTGRRPDKGLPRSRQIRKLGRWDQLVEWFKPATRPAWMDQATYDALPASLTVREFRYRIHRRGFRVRVVTAVTTLLDEKAYPVKELADLYFARWRVECNLRQLKMTLGMDVLKCHWLDGVRRELLAFALAYNLVRAVMVQAADDAGVEPDRVSFIDALRWLRLAVETVLPLRPLQVLINPLRPGRYQPRVRKRRPKAYPPMDKPRWKLLQELTNKRVPA